jgi:hypothetical protein
MVYLNIINKYTETSQTLSIFNKLLSKWNCINYQRDTTQDASPQSYDLYLSDLTKKHRHEPKRKIRKFNDDYSSEKYRY